MSGEKGPNLSKGTILPAVELPEASGSRVRLDHYRGRRNLVLFLTHSRGCAACEQKVRELVAGMDVLAAEEAELLVVVPGARAEAAQLKEGLGLTLPVLADEEGLLGVEGMVIVADRFGEIFACRCADPQHTLPSVTELAEELAFIGVQCPE